MRKNRLFQVLAVILALTLGLSTMGDVNAATLTSKVTISVSGVLASTLDLVTAQAPLVQNLTVDIATGTGAGQADMIWSDTRTIAASTTEDIDLQASLTDAFGAAFTPAKIKLLYVCADSANTNNVVIGGDAASVLFLSVATTTATIQPGGCFVFLNQKTGITVTATSADIIQVANSGAGTSVVYKIIILGTSA